MWYDWSILLYFYLLGFVSSGIDTPALTLLTLATNETWKSQDYSCEQAIPLILSSFPFIVLATRSISCNFFPIYIYTEKTVRKLARVKCSVSAIVLKTNEVTHTVSRFDSLPSFTLTTVVSAESSLAVILTSRALASSLPIHLEKCVSTWVCFTKQTCGGLHMSQETCNTQQGRERGGGSSNTAEMNYSAKNFWKVIKWYFHHTSLSWRGNN